MPGYAHNTPGQGLTPHGRVGASPTSKLVVPARGRKEILLSVQDESAVISLAFGPEAVLGEGPQFSQGDGLLRLETKTAISVITEAEGPNEKQKITVAKATGGTFTLSLDGEETEPIAHNADDEDIEEALEEVVGTGNVAVTGEGPFVAEFKGALKGQDVSTLVADTSGLEGETEEVEEEEVEIPATVTIETTVPGGIDVVFCEA